MIGAGILAGVVGSGLGLSFTATITAQSAPGTPIYDFTSVLGSKTLASFSPSNGTIAFDGTNKQVVAGATGLALGTFNYTITDSAGGTYALTVTAVAATITSISGFGDSNTAGIGATTQANCYLNLLAGKLGISTINNQGVSNTVLQNSAIPAGPAGTVGQAGTNNGRDRFVASLLGANKTDVIVCQYGNNDGRAAGAPTTFNTTEFANDYGEMLSGLIIGGYTRDRIYMGNLLWFTDSALGIGTGTPSPAGYNAQTRAGYEAYNTVALQLAKDFGVRFADIYATTYGHTEWLASDGLHRNDAGHAACANAFFNATIQNASARPAFGVISAPSSSSLSIAWTAPTPPSGLTITNYTVQAAFEGNFRFFVSSSVSGLSTTLTGLSGGNYRARIRANFSDGTSSPWEFASSAVQVGTTVAPLVLQSPTFTPSATSAFGKTLSGGAATVDTSVLSTSTITLPFSVECRVNTTGAVLAVAIAQKRGSGTGWYMAAAANGALQAGIGNSSGSATNFTTTAVINDGADHTLKMVFTSSGTTLLCDGVVQSTVATVLTATNLNQCTLRTNNGSSTWTGNIDEVVITPGDGNISAYTPATTPRAPGFGGIVYHLDDDQGFGYN